MRNSVTHIAGLLLCTVASQASAQTPTALENDPPAKIASYADLNLSSADGRRVLQGRIVRAASGLCNKIGRKSLDEKIGERRCMLLALSGAGRKFERAVANATHQPAANTAITLALR